LGEHPQLVLLPQLKNKCCEINPFCNVYKTVIIIIMTSPRPVYQIDCQKTKKGKLFAGTKRRVCWHFGFADAQAIQNGRSGTDCRGAEHQIVMVWSLTSGKQLVLVDGHEVHWSKSSRMFDKFECEWTMASTGSKAKVMAHASTPLVKKEGFRQFDLLIDGVSFWDMPKMYELGIGDKAADPATPSRVVVTRPPSAISLRQVAPTPDMDDYSVMSDIHTVAMYSSQPHLSRFEDLQSPRPVSPSPSMPDLTDLQDPFAGSNSLFMSPPPHQSLKPAVTPSPTSVMVSINPFDVYATPRIHHSQPSPYHVQQHHRAATMALQQHQMQSPPGNPFLQYPYQQPLPHQQSPCAEQRTVYAGY
jgi:hypothetical protein